MLSSAFARAAQRTVLWCLLIAAPVYAVSSGVSQVIGPRHAGRAAVHLDEPLRGWHEALRAIGRDVSSVQLHHSTFDRHCHVPAPAAVAVLDVRAVDSLGDDSPDATSLFGFALISPASIAPLAATSSPPSRSHVMAVLTGDGSRLERPPKA
jgi:hypothetical protein